MPDSINESNIAYRPGAKELNISLLCRQAMEHWSVGDAQESLQCLNSAVDLAATIPDDINREFALKEVAVAMYVTGCHDRAMNILVNLSGTWISHLAFGEIAGLLIPQGMLEKADELLRLTITDSTETVEQVGHLIRSYVAAGLSEKAVALVEAIANEVAKDTDVPRAVFRYTELASYFAELVSTCKQTNCCNEH